MARETLAMCWIPASDKICAPSRRQTSCEIERLPGILRGDLINFKLTQHVAVHTYAPTILNPRECFFFESSEICKWALRAKLLKDCLTLHSLGFIGKIEWTICLLSNSARNLRSFVGPWGRIRTRNNQQRSRQRNKSVKASCSVEIKHRRFLW